MSSTRTTSGLGSIGNPICLPQLAAGGTSGVQPRARLEDHREEERQAPQGRGPDRGPQLHGGTGRHPRRHRGVVVQHGAAHEEGVLDFAPALVTDGGGRLGASDDEDRPHHVALRGASIPDCHVHPHPCTVRCGGDGRQFSLRQSFKSFMMDWHLPQPKALGSGLAGLKMGTCRSWPKRTGSTVSLMNLAYFGQSAFLAINALKPSGLSGSAWMSALGFGILNSRSLASLP